MTLQMNPAPTLAFNAAPAAGANADRPKAEIYLNVGIPMELPNPETGEMETTFISLPFGLAADTMSKASMSARNTNWNNIAQAKNWLLETLVDMGKTQLKKGEAQVIDGIQVEIRRVGEAVEPEAGENPFISKMQTALKAVG